MHPNGQLPAYEWQLSDVNPPVHAWAAWRVFEIDRKQHGGPGDLGFLERVLHNLGRDLANSRDWPNWSADSEFRAARDKSAAERENAMPAPAAATPPKKGERG